ncbi:hypothetical protein ElyMa_000874100 [Elysia marginata]|uniref:Uncharacterized protein n=1 Tax=Elysia marginata TaxID=1093978 RepID=A0AAV4H7H7_9GAST|nr:hypothetical protein ElyMa_000874100 [Elysia marginata]
MEMKGIGMNFRALFFISVLVVISASLGGSQHNVFTKSHVESNFSPGHHINLQTWANNEMQDSLKVDRCSVSLPQRPSNSFETNGRNSTACHGYSSKPACTSTEIDQDLDLTPTVDYDSLELQGEDYCDPISSNCPRELEVTSSHPVVLSRKEVVLPHGVACFTLNIVLDVENFLYCGAYYNCEFLQEELTLMLEHGKPTLRIHDKICADTSLNRGPIDYKIAC